MNWPSQLDTGTIEPIDEEICDGRSGTKTLKLLTTGALPLTCTEQAIVQPRPPHHMKYCSPSLLLLVIAAGQGSGRGR